MLENKTLIEVIVWFMASGVAAIFFEHIPGWDRLPPELKLWLVRALAVLAPVVTATLGVYVPAEYLSTPVLQLLLGISAYLITQWVHKLDKAIDGLAMEARYRTVKEDYN